MAKPPRAATKTTRHGVFRGGGAPSGTPPPLNGSPAVAYRRVSKGGQDPENQRADVERVARVRGFEITTEFVDVAGATEKRPAFEAMMHAARRGDVHVVVVWALDRFGRSMLGNVNTIVALDELGVRVISVREPWLDTGGPVRNLLLAIFSWLAEQERRRIIERTNAGLARARAQGKKLGRPKRYIAPAALERARALQAAGVPIRTIAQRVQVPRATLHAVLKRTTPSELAKARAERRRAVRP